MLVKDQNIESVIDALVFKIKHLEREIAWNELKITELMEENKKLKGDNDGKA